MIHQPILTDFPQTVFATAKRRAQAAIQTLRKGLIHEKLSGYAVLFENIIPGNFLETHKPEGRTRHYGHITVFWAWMAQILEGNASCTKAVSLVQAWCRTLRLPVPSSDTSAYCQARGRLTEAFLKKIDQRVEQTLSQRIQPQDLWRGHQLKAIDGTTLTLMDTVSNQLKYAQHSSQEEGCGFPIMGLVGMVNLSHGGVVGFEKCGSAKHDARVAPSLLKHIEEGDLILGDRAFCSYEFIVRIISERKGHILMRLHQARHRKLDWRKGKKVSPIERLVRWIKPSQQPVGSELSTDEWRTLPETLTLRYIKLGYENRAGQKAALVVVTDLLAPKKYPAEEVADLYMERWQIELKFRDLKTTFGMEHFAMKTPEMAHKTLWMMIITYNLLRIAMQEAAHQAGKKVNEMSVEGTRCVLTSSHESFREVARKPRLHRRLHRELLANCAEHIIDIRPFRQEPRALKRRPKNYQLLTGHRRIFQEVHHRSHAYRKKLSKNA